jgi:N-acetylglucosaminyldiphosphoundecaprenol N-acetyl-beta-D-mannosaminyltransferase
MFGLTIDNLTMAETLDRIEELIRSGGVHQHVAVNVDKVVKATRDPSLMAIINDCDLVSADGQPVVWASRLLGRPIKERVTGIDLMVNLFDRAAKNGSRVYLVGARQQVLEDAAASLERHYPGLVVAGIQHGYWASADEEEVVARIQAAQVDMLFVALPSPRKEEFLAAHKDRIRVPFVMGVGGAFDVYSGHISRAPRWMRRVGLEWLYRLSKEPARMWRRYLVEDLAFLGILAREFRRERRNRGQGGGRAPVNDPSRRV